MSARPTLHSMATARQAVHNLRDQLDTRRPTSTHTRHLADGSTKRITRRGARKVCDGAATLMLEILLPAARTKAQRALKSPFFYNLLVTDTGLTSPRLEFTGEQLAERRTMCARTIRNYLRQLKQHGFIVDYKWRGRQASFWLWVNPAFLWDVPAEAVSGAPVADSMPAPEADFSAERGNNFPPTEILESLQESKKVDIGRVDKRLSGSAGIPLLESEGCNSPLDAGHTSKSGAGARAAAEAEAKARRAVEATQAVLRQRIEACCVAFWAYAKHLLYPQRAWTAHQEVLALRAIWSGVYIPAMRHQPAGNLDRVHDSLIERLQLVRRYQRLHPENHCPLPYAEMVPGRGYFDQENQHGFERTRFWLAAKRARRNKGTTALDTALRVATVELQQRWQLDRGQRIPACDNAKRQDLTTLYWKHHRTLRRLGGDEALHLLAGRVAMLGLTPPAGA